MEARLNGRAANQWTAGNLSGIAYIAYTYTYGGLGRQVSRKQGATRTDLWFDQTGMTLESGGSSRTYLRDPSGLPLSVLNGATLSNFGRDRLGSVTGLTSTTQTLAGSMTYDPWGRAQATTGNAADSNLRFTGGRRDPGTGHHQFGVRTYACAWARFTQLDPLPASITDVNRYAYANCNPMNFVDPTGTSACGDATIGAVALLAAGTESLSILLAALILGTAATGGLATPLALGTLVLIEALEFGTGGRFHLLPRLLGVSGMAHDHRGNCVHWHRCCSRARRYLSDSQKQD